MLAWFALGYVVQRISRVRAVEWGIARTRGVRPRVWLATVFVEPTVAILIGTMMGAAAGVPLRRSSLAQALAPRPRSSRRSPS